MSDGHCTEVKGVANTKVLTTSVEADEALVSACRSFDFEFNGECRTEIPDFSPPPQGWGIGLIVGPSGSGKSTLLKDKFPTTPLPVWNPQKAIVSQLPDAPEERLLGVGLNSIPAWCRPYHVLSTGEKFRADLAYQIGDFAVIDEFTSTVDRNVAKSCAASVGRFIRSKNFKSVVFATCHLDVEEWLCPDWVFNTGTGELYAPELLRRPSITLSIHQCDKTLWRMFRHHHYLSANLNATAKCFAAFWGDHLVGFSSALPFPNGNFKNAWREHRTVVFPDFQGLGIGVRLSDFIAGHFFKSGRRFFSKTSHPRMGEHRENSVLWKPTSKNLKSRGDYSARHKTKEDGHKMRHSKRVCYSHEFAPDHFILRLIP